MLGALIWEKEGKLRFSLDRADLWDLRPTANLDHKNWTFEWVIDRWKNNQYQEVQQMFDLPYDRDPGPSKIPAGALEFNISAKVKRVELILSKGLCEIEWANGMKMETFVHATKQEGWFQFSGIKENILPSIVPPPYHLSAQSGEDNPVTGQDLRRLGYPAGDLKVEKEFITYTQEGWNGFTYRIEVRWNMKNDMLTGHWNIQVLNKNEPASVVLPEEKISTPKYLEILKTHKDWWHTYWQQCSIQVPDAILLKQWYLEQYKFGAATGNGAPPISLQAVWTADNGKLPPWKGDFHNDLNTQLSYWPAYSANKLDQSMGFLDWMEKNKPIFKNYTSQYFQTNGITVPGDIHAATRRIAQTMAGQYSSTAQDVARGKPNEIDYLNGYVVRRGRAHPTWTPHHARIVGYWRRRIALDCVPPPQPGASVAMAAACGVGGALPWGA
jgi:alpha-L-fucosidase 2